MLALLDRCEISPSFDLVNSATVLLTLGPQWAIVLGERPPGWAYFLGGSGGTNTTEARRQHVCNDKIMETSQKMLHAAVWQCKLASFYIEIESLVEALHFSFSLSGCQSVSMMALEWNSYHDAAEGALTNEEWKSDSTVNREGRVGKPQAGALLSHKALGQLTINPADQLLQSLDFPLDARLSEGVVVLRMNTKQTGVSRKPSPLW